MLYASILPFYMAGLGVKYHVVYMSVGGSGSDPL